MANGDSVGPTHPVRTKSHSYEYFFYTKHHRNGPSNEAQWLLEPHLTHDQEFWVFDNADELDLSDAHGHLYGLRQKVGDQYSPLGTRGEQVAKFPRAAANQAWHGYPIWPIAVPREDEDLRPVPKPVLTKMVEKKVIDSKQRKRLGKGDHI